MITLGLGTQANFSGGGGINPSGSTWLKELLSDVTLGSIIQGNCPGRAENVLVCQLTPRQGMSIEILEYFNIILRRFEEIKQDQYRTKSEGK